MKSYMKCACLFLNLNSIVDAHRLHLLLLWNWQIIDNVRYVRACHVAQPFQLFDESCQWIQRSIR